MFGLGFFEFMLILVGILIFVRPKDLPKFVYRVGKIYGQIKETYNKFYREINLLKNQMDEIVEREKNLGLNKKPGEINQKDSDNQKVTLTPPHKSAIASEPASSITFDPKSKKSSPSKKTISKKVKKKNQQTTKVNKSKKTVAKESKIIKKKPPIKTNDRKKTRIPRVSKNIKS